LVEVTKSQNKFSKSISEGIQPLEYFFLTKNQMLTLEVKEPHRLMEQG